MANQNNGLWSNAFMIGGIIVKTDDNKMVDHAKVPASDQGFTNNMEHSGFAIDLHPLDCPA